jgi:hypothetical protein
MKHKGYERIMIIGLGFLLMYAGFTLLLLPMMLSASSHSLILSSTQKVFGFEDDLNSVGSIYGNPTVVSSPVANGSKAVECQNGDYVRWDIAKPSKTIELTFKVYWTKFPTIANESLAVGAIEGSHSGRWLDVFHSTLYCDAKGYRGWSLWTGIPSGRSSFVSSNVVYALETNRWYIIRMTADLNTGTYKLYMDGTELASITDVIVPENVNVNFFLLGPGTQGDSVFITYFDDVAVSFLKSESPEPISRFNWIPLQVLGFGMIVGGGYVLWPKKKRESTTSVMLLIRRQR